MQALRAQLLALVVGAVLALSVSAGALGVVGGTPDSGHPYVAAAFNDHELCSGFFLSPTVFVTAAHCFAPGSTATVTFGDVVHPGEVFTTKAPTYTGTVFDDPQFCFGCGNGMGGGDTHDTAVVVFSSPVQGISKFPTLARPGSLSSLPTGTAIDMVGYGVSVMDKGMPVAFGTKLIGAAKTLGTGTLGDEYVKLAGKPGACIGDSGGPDLLAGTDIVVGVTSFGNGNKNCGGVSYSQRTDVASTYGFISGFLR